MPSTTKDGAAGSLLIPDVPTDFTTEPDAFGHDDYARTLATLLRDAPAPFTVGLYGPWGQGKSSVLERLPSHLSTEDVAVVSFNAWRHEGQALRRHFLKNVAAELVDKRKLSKRFARTSLRVLDADVSESAPALVLSLGRFLLRALLPGALLAVALLLAVSYVDDETIKAAAESPWGIVAAGAAVASFLLTLLSQLFADAQRTTTLKRLDEPDRFTDLFERLLGSVRVRRVVVAIDDLDRCSPDRAVETLTTVKTYLEPTVRKRGRWVSLVRRIRGRSPADAIFVIAVDDVALLRHIEARERRSDASDDESRAHAEEYLRKFFALTVRVRDLDDEDMRGYARGLVEPTLRHWHGRAGANVDVASAAAADLITLAVGHNPRRIKQFVNSFNARMQLIAEREAGAPASPPRLATEISSSIDTLLLLALIEERWPDAFAALLANDSWLQRWRRAAMLEERPPTSFGADDWRRFAEMLRRSAEPPRDLRPYLNLTQSPTERTLPRIAELRRSVRSGDWPTADEIVVADEEAAAYLRWFHAAIERDLHAGYSRAAVVYVRALLNMPSTIERHAASVGAIVEDALRHDGVFRTALLGSGPDRLFERLPAFAPSVAEAAADVLVDGLVGDDESSRAWLSAVAVPSGMLPEPFVERARAAIRDAYEQAHGRHFAQMVTEVPPTLLSPALAATAVERLEAFEREVLAANDDRTEPIWNRSIEILHLLTACADADVLSRDAARRVLGSLTRVLSPAAREGGPTGLVLTLLIRALGLAPADAATADRLADQTRTIWDDDDAPALRAHLLRLLSAVMRDGHPPDEAVQSEWVRRFKEDPRSIMPWLDLGRPASDDAVVPLVKRAMAEHEEGWAGDRSAFVMAVYAPVWDRVREL